MRTRIQFQCSLHVAACLAFGTTPAVGVTLYVWQDNPNPAPPYTNWASAATNIQDGVDAAAVGDRVLVTNGVYASGGTALNGPNRVFLNKAILVQSVNGPTETWIVGGAGGGSPLYDGAVRCAYVGN